MKLLAISDIHGKVESVRRLRERVANGFDAIVLAGDIGKDLDTAAQVFGKRCPQATALRAGVGW